MAQGYHAAKVPENATKDQVPLMLQKLLEDRFKLKVHRESRPLAWRVRRLDNPGTLRILMLAGLDFWNQ